MSQGDFVKGPACGIQNLELTRGEKDECPYF